MIVHKIEDNEKLKEIIIRHGETFSKIYNCPKLQTLFIHNMRGQIRTDMMFENFTHKSNTFKQHFNGREYFLDFT